MAVLRKAFQPKSWTLTLTCVLLVLGIMLSIQFRTQQDLAKVLTAQKTEDLVAIWDSLEQKRGALEQEIDKLRQQQFKLSQAINSRQTTIANAAKDIEKLELALGALPASGPGITVTITGDTPILYLDLIDLINELWTAGAQAIAVNEHRITAYTAIGFTQKEETLGITINGKPLLFPIVVKAIGDPHTLKTGLTYPGGIVSNFTTMYKVPPVISEKEKIDVPAATNLPSLQHAKIKS
ncbi:MAG: DUF881 domain-containing protein [Clostridia bacterium]|nr:DUF881 domain-containing protein [Clostridia bacterium]